MVCVVNQSLKMGKGKIAAQVGHGAVMATMKAGVEKPINLEQWFTTGQKKVCLKGRDAEHLLELEQPVVVPRKLQHARRDARTVPGELAFLEHVKGERGLVREAAKDVVRRVDLLTVRGEFEMQQSPKKLSGGSSRRTMVAYDFSLIKLHELSGTQTYRATSQNIIN
jgi:peptidyl-tRNA hydrolase